MLKNENGTLIKYLGSNPKYSLLENERKWVVERSYLKGKEGHPHHTIIDKYLDNSKIRIRSVEDSQTGEVIYKLCKKYGTDNPVSEPITTIYLSKQEYEAFMALAGKIIKKNRYKVEEEGATFAIDLFLAPKLNYLIAETEAGSLEGVKSIKPPTFSVKEVTNDIEYSGGFIANSSNHSL